VALFSQMRSGRRFRNDLHGVTDVTSEVGQPTLIIASRKDGAVSFAHAESLAAGIRNAELVVSESDSHSIWFGLDYPSIASQIRSFLTH
jgi:pimeloyl-ACP methyl ester carboxylesterase